MRSAVGGKISETGHDMTITITFIKTSVADTTTWITADEAGIPVNCDSPPADGPLYTDDGEFSPFNEIVPWRVSCTLGEDANGEPILSTPISWLTGTPQQICYDEFSIDFNTDEYWLSDRDGRIALGCFSTKNDNIAKFNFDETTISDTLFTQLYTSNLISNGDSRIIKNADFYQNNPGFGTTAFEPFGDWEYLQLDGVGYNVGYSYVDDTSNSEYPPPIGNPWGSLINTYIQSENYGSTSGQEEDGIYGYAGYYPYPHTDNLEYNYQWASWQISEECYSYGKCLRFQATDFWDDPSNISGTTSPYISNAVLNLTDKNQYRTLNQYQKFYDVDNAFTNLNPYSSLEVSFWMKTIGNDEFFDIDNPPQVEAAILRGTNPGVNTNTVYTEYGDRIGRQGQPALFSNTTLAGNGFTSNQFSDIGIENSNNTTMMTMINQNVFKSVTELSSIDISDDRTLNIGSDNYQIFTIINSLFSQYRNQTVTANNLLSESEVIAQGNQYVYSSPQINSDGDITLYPTSPLFLNEDGTPATDIILTRAEITGDCNESGEDLDIFRIGYDGTNWSYNFDTAQYRYGTDLGPNNQYLIFDIRNPNFYTAGGYADRSTTPPPISVSPDGTIRVFTNSDNKVDHYFYTLTFEKIDTSLLPLPTQQYYFRVGEQWNYEWMRTDGYSLPVINNGALSNPLYSAEGLSGLLQINLERGLFGTTPKNHNQNTPVQVWSENPELTTTLNETGGSSNLDLVTTFHNHKYLEQFGNYNSLTTTLNTNNSYQLGSMNRFKNNVQDVWEKKEFIFNFNDKYVKIDSNSGKPQVSDLFFAIQAGNDFRGTVFLDNFEVRESYEFKPDCDVRKKKGPNDYGVGNLTEYYDSTITEQLEAYIDTTAPLEVQFYFYAKHFINEPLNTNHPSHPIYNDFRNGMFYIHDVDWGDGSPKEFTAEPLKLGDDVAVYHAYKSGGVFSVTGYMIRMKPDENYNPLGVIHNQKFNLKINVNEGLDEDFTYFGSDGFSFIPYKNTLPVIGGYSKQSIYYKAIKRQLGILELPSTERVENQYQNKSSFFKNQSDRLKTEISLTKMDSLYGNEFELLNEYQKQRTSEPNDNGSIVNNGFNKIVGELGNSIGDADITNIRYFNEPKQLWEMIGFDNESVGIPDSRNYWKNIIPKDYSIYNREGLVDGELIDTYSEQNWLGINEELGFENNYYYPVLPKYGADGKFIEGSVAGPGGGNLPFPLEGPITNEYYTDESLVISINKESVESNILDDNSGNKNYGFAYGDYRPVFDSQTLEPKKNKNFGRIKTTKKNGAF